MSLLLVFQGGGTPPGGGSQSIDLSAIATAESVPGPVVTPGPVTIAVGSIATAESVDGPNVFNYLAIALPAIPGGEHVPGPTIVLPSAPAPTSRLAARAMDGADPLIELVELDEAITRAWEDALNGSGSGKVVLDRVDPDLALFDYGDVIRFDVDGAARYAILVERKNEKTVDAGEESAELVEVSGRGTVAVFEDAVVYPELGPDRQPFNERRLFTGASTDFDDSGWPYALLRKRQDVAASPYSGAPSGWSDPLAYWLAPQPDAGVPPQPVGKWYARRKFTAPTEGTIRLSATADDGFLAWLDGVSILGETRALLWNDTKAVDVFVTAGEHTLFFEVENIDRPTAEPTNISSLLYSVAEVNTDGTLGDVLARSDATTKVVAYPPTPPGFTPGAIVRILVEEAQARGALGPVTLTFTDATDSAGRAWDTTSDIGFDVGKDLLSVLLQLAETYFEIAMSPARFELSLYLTRGTVTAAAFTTGTNVLELTTEGAG